MTFPMQYYIYICTCQILPGQGQPVHDEGGGEPVEVQDKGVQSEKMSHIVQL